ncbi:MULTISPECIES: cell wall metabolism sensor histidine kinase WalK [Deinococcus]|jgi:signal transduction histidine kinase|uniref:histidine kinase n=5 Tax=Deinococcus TaxID=1298 RepID=A0AAE4BNJ0_9DEIO|nr:MULTISPECIES: HAMP domain-containing sensor histidine kinase [Deinococcus]MDR6221403.1 signal transduction histidine kinase [Deinococcus soli (ex Cha et al. 2016)]MDR6331384.1 signal transduction histidine kinase [Deinococcus soli (ex Cha et al. 2016)]MDR6754542.1 signal transduction histidine kinase [Deinococcus soli (ex Cha et al. 2016)]BBN97090.1 two-component sensor histidine kinase [Deinococcus grandis]GAQ23634.1 sensor protein, phoR [Deinococcus grandis]
MRLFPRLLLNHLAVMAVLSVVLLVAAELAAHPFIQHHVNEMVQLLGDAGAAMRGDLNEGMRATLTRALFSALPPALLVAAVTAWVAARRVTASVRTLQAGSAALARGEYRRRLPEGGQDELAELAHSFNTMASTLASVEQSRVELIGNVAHELRAPVAAVRGYVEAAQDGVMAHDQALSAIQRELAGLERLAGDLSLVSRVEAGQVELTLQDVLVAALLAQVQDRYALAFEDKGVTLQVDAGRAGLQVRADPARSVQILANLLSNALRHTAPGGAVRVGAQDAGGGVRLVVQDTGTGIAPEHLHRVFERFFRADAARTRGEGCGVGLTVARGLTRAMGGELSVTSTPGVGSVFQVELPASRDRLDPPAFTET